MKKYFTKHLVAALFLLVFTTHLNAQAISLVPNLSTSDYGYMDYPITIGSTLYIRYSNTAGKYQLAKYDGSTLTVIPNPSALDYGYYGNPIAIGSNLYFRYRNAVGYNLAKYDGNTLTVIPNPSALDEGYQGYPVAIGSTLYFRYKNAANNYQLAKYDGNTLTLIPNQSASDNGYASDYSSYFVNGSFISYDISSPIAIGSTLYFNYRSSLTGGKKLAKYDGNTLTVIANPSASDYGYAGNPIAVGSTLYFSYKNAASTYQLAKYDGSVLTVIANPSALDGGYYNTDVKSNPIAIGSNLYFNYANAAGKHQLAKYDGNALTVIANPSASDYGYNEDYGYYNYNGFPIPYDNSPKAIGSTLYFKYQNAAGKSQLAKYDGSTLTVIPNPSASDLGFYNNSIAIGSTLYYSYQNAAGKYQLAKYDGSTLTVIPNPSASDYGYYPNQTNNNLNDTHTYPIAIGSTLYYSYLNATNRFQLAKYDGNALTVIANPSASANGYFGDLIATGSNIFFRYWNETGYFQLAKYDGNALTLIANPSTPGNDANFNPIAIGNILYFRYVNSDNKFQLAKYTITTLPLTLLSFTATQQTNSIVTNWQTTNEVNVSHFTVQRSTNGSSFTDIGTVTATGGGNYSYNDDLSTINTQPPTIYYRLKMVDKDGSFTYSKVVAVSFTIHNSPLTIYPNPVKETLFAQVTSSKAEKVTVKITDMQGRVLQQQQMQIQIGSTSISLNTSGLAKGSYVLVVNGEVLQQKQFLKE